MINLILFGAPGAGKGTQAALLVAEYDLLHISTGDLFRYEIGNKTELGLLAKSYIDKGALVPDEVTVGMLKNKVDANPDVKGYILDGFPRTIAQSEALDAFLASKEQEVTALVEVDVEEEELIKRLLNRALTSGRSDDADVNIIKNRIATYRKHTMAVAGYYAKKDKSHKVNGLGSMKEVTTRLKTTINAIIA